MNKDLPIVPQDFRFLKNKKREVLDSHVNAFTKEPEINNSMNRGLEYLTTPSKQPKWSEYTVIQARCRKLTADYDIITSEMSGACESQGEMNSVVENGFWFLKKIPSIHLKQ